MDIDSFVEWCANTGGTVYFHNLRFDGKFILPWLFQNGYRHTTEQHPRKGQFTTLISKMGAWYSTTVHWKNGTTTTFQDSLKKIPMGVSAIPKTFGLDEVKGEIDYEKPRPVGYEPTEDEWEYLYHDCKIVALALRQILASGANRMTVGSDSISSFKETFGEKRFDRSFPILDPELDEVLRPAYKGGWTYADKRHRLEVIGEGSVYDVNSLYPSVMYNALMPIGEPREVMNYDAMTMGDNNHLYIFKVTIVAKIKPDHLPCIQIKGSSRFVATEYVDEIDEPTEVTVTCVDWTLWNEHYDIEILDFHAGYEFRTAHNLFNQWIDFWTAIKVNATTPGERALAKLHLNSLYGKFGTNPDQTGLVPIMHEDGIVRYELGEPERGDPVYIPLACFVTAYARGITIRAAQENYDTFLYADTDSIHLSTRTVTNIDIHPSRLGAWKHEYDFTSAIYSRAKCYTEVKWDGEVETHIAGMPAKLAEQVTIEDHITGKTFDGKMMPRAVVGGVVLVPTTFKLNMRAELTQDRAA